MSPNLSKKIETDFAKNFFTALLIASYIKELISEE